MRIRGCVCVCLALVGMFGCACVSVYDGGTRVLVSQQNSSWARPYPLAIHRVQQTYHLSIHPSIYPCMHACISRFSSHFLLRQSPLYLSAVASLFTHSRFWLSLLLSSLLETDLLLVFHVYVYTFTQHSNAHNTRTHSVAFALDVAHWNGCQRACVSPFLSLCVFVYTHL